MFHTRDNFRLPLTLVALAAILAMAAPSFGQSSGNLRGRVTDGQGGGIAGAKITATAQNPPRMVLEGETDDEGNYRIMGLRANSYELVAEKEGLGSAAAVFSIREGQNLTVDMDFGAAAASATAALSEEDLANVERIEELKASFELGVAASAAGDYQEAISQFNIAVGIADFCHDCYQNIGIAQAELENWEEAEVAFQRVIELKPDYAAAYTGLSNVYNMLRRFDEAAEASAEAARLSGAGVGAATDPIAVYNQGIIFWNAQRFDEAKSQFQQTISLDPSHAEAHYFLAMANLNQGNMAEAATALEQYIELAPDGQYADQARGMLPQLRQ